MKIIREPSPVTIELSSNDFRKLYIILDHIASMKSDPFFSQLSINFSKDMIRVIEEVGL